MIKLTNEFINSTNELSSGTYVVEYSITLSHDLTISENVTLIFQGGKFVVAEDCTEGITISGTNTRLNAPICTIFGKGINVVGSWDIDRAYPQWFEIEKEIVSTEHIMVTSEGNDIYEDRFYDDWSTPINKAIKMKQIGEVFLKEGKYSIANAIHINKGIQFIGENSQAMDNDCNGCTRIFPVAEGLNQFSDTYMVYINSYITNETDSTNNGIKEIEHAIDIYIDQSTLIKSICFTDYINKESNQSHEQKCILAGGGVQLDRIVWYNFLQGVKYTDTYNDTKSITNCSFKYFGEPVTNNDNKDIYAIDASGLGDAFRFEHNAIHHTCNGKALKLSQCGGASIQGNIINSDIIITWCKAIVFNGNHCESGIQVEIIDSCVTTNNNFFEKGARPNILIHNSEYGDKSVVSMNNDMFLMYNFPRFYIDTNKTADEIFNSFKNQIQKISECDIHIDRNTILNINDVYRYEFGGGLMGKMYPFGINIEKNELNHTKLTPLPLDFQLKEFNKYSYLASCSSKILSGYKLNMQATINDINTPRLNCSQQNGGVKWLGEDGTYRYYYQIVWDKDRGIIKTLSSSNIDNSIFNLRWYVGNDIYQDTNTITHNGSGVLLDMSEDINGNCAMVRLIREKIEDNALNNSFQEVYVPVCGSRYLFDNGISVCGYKWKPYDKSILFEPCDKNMEMLRINNGNVECYTKREDGITPTSGWKRGDVIHNISSNPSTYVVPDDIA